MSNVYEYRRNRTQHLPLSYRIMTLMQNTWFLSWLASQTVPKYLGGWSEKRDREFAQDQQDFFVWYLAWLSTTVFAHDKQHQQHFEGKRRKWNIDDLYECRKTTYDMYGYSELRDYIHMPNGLRETEEEERYFALSGGTTDINQTNKKFIYIPPVIKTLTRKAFSRLLLSYLCAYPDTTLLSKKILPLWGSIRQQEPTWRAGDVSALLMEQQSWFGQARYPYPVEVLTAPRQEKYDMLLSTICDPLASSTASASATASTASAAVSAGERSSTEGFPTEMSQTGTAVSSSQVWALLGVTKWTALFLEDIEKKYPQHKEHLQSSLEAIFRWGVDCTPYLPTFERRGITRLVGIYNAAEGVIWYQILEDRDAAQKASNEVWYRFAPTWFFEFAPPTSFDAEGRYISWAPVVASWQVTPELLEQRWNTVVLIYSTPGQVRSVMDMLHLECVPLPQEAPSISWWIKKNISPDTSENTDITYRLRFQIVGRVTWFINLVWEELLEQQARLALYKTAEELGMRIAQYTVAPALTWADGEQAHEWLIESADAIPNHAQSEQFAIRLDERLQRINGDYADKRHVAWLNRQQITRVASGSFDRYLAAQSKLWGQNKILPMSSKRTYIEHVKAVLGV